MRNYIMPLAALTLFAGVAQASEDIADKYPDSVLYNKPVEWYPNVWSAIGATAPPTYANAGHNNNLSFIVTGEGVVVVNAGAAYALAEALHDHIKEITDQPVVLVINENGQGHAMLGNNYWIAQGVPVLAHVDAAQAFNSDAFAIMESMRGYNRDKAEGTDPMGPTETFTDEHLITLGDFRIEVRYLGPAHSPGDIVVWLPDQSIMIAGDMAFHERMLPLFSDTCTSCWIETWDTSFEPMGATYVIPGHGHPTTMEQVRRYTRDYLQHLRDQIGAHLDAGGTLTDAYYIDQDAYRGLDTFEELATRNAGRVFEEMEWE